MKHISGIIIIFCLLFLGSTYHVTAQQQEDSLKITELNKVVVVSYVSMKGIGHLNEMQPPIIYAGKKTEVIIVDSADANKAINNTRAMAEKTIFIICSLILFLN